MADNENVAAMSMTHGFNLNHGFKLNHGATTKKGSIGQKQIKALDAMYNDNSIKSGFLSRSQIILVTQGLNLNHKFKPNHGNPAKKGKNSEINSYKRKKGDQTMRALHNRFDDLTGIKARHHHL